VKTKGKRVCEVCGTALADSSAFCPVCALQGALKPESGGSTIDDGTSELRFEHYRVLQNEDGTPVELGHGAMGLTYKAFDIHLQDHRDAGGDRERGLQCDRKEGARVSNQAGKTPAYEPLSTHS
jgi:hypothetical protein